MPHSRQSPSPRPLEEGYQDPGPAQGPGWLATRAVLGARLGAHELPQQGLDEPVLTNTEVAKHLVKWECFRQQALPKSST